MAILTPEQQAEAAKIQADRDARMKQFRDADESDEAGRRRPVKTPELCPDGGSRLKARKLIGRMLSEP